MPSVRTLCIALALTAQSAIAQVRPGIEVLVTDSVHLIRGKRVGVITNHSGRTRDGRSSIDLLFKTPGVKLTALFGPEHGLRGIAQAGEKVASSVDSATGVPVYSLYGETRVPRPQDLKDVDVLVYDIQDVGARVYTFQWTMSLSAAAAGANVPFIVCDRPDPIRADRVEGNILEKQFETFVGQFRVALRYGLTPAELLRYLVGEKLVDANIRVVPMQGYRRSMWYDETKLPWINPSPNIKSLDGALLYPGTVFFEGTNLSEGRGTDAPFQLVGAPWLANDIGEIVAELNAARLPGVRFEATERVIEAGQKQAGPTPVPMIFVKVTDRNAAKPVAVGLRMLRAIYARHKDQWKWIPSHADRLAGTAAMRAAVEAGTLDALIASWDADAARFSEMTRKYWLYP
jgi:uncharacterized protein YbbC (DUF1343 family)